MARVYMCMGGERNRMTGRGINNDCIGPWQRKCIGVSFGLGGAW